MLVKLLLHIILRAFFMILKSRRAFLRNTIYKALELLGCQYFGNLATIQKITQRRYTVDYVRFLKIIC